MERQILHIDMNNFYASVECKLDKSLQGKCVAVCGSAENRHGIVLAKNYEAKGRGVRTGEAIWEAKQKCPELVTVEPHMDEYVKYSRLAKEIYARYTDRVEPYGLDECWLDVTGCTYMHGTGAEIAEEIRAAVESELELTVSCGVSFNKIFAKLGSDMKKPNAVTVIPQATFREQLWGMNVGELIGVGYSTVKTLKSYGIHTIGDLARADPDVLQYKLKSYAYQLVRYANGEDNSVVLHKDFEVPAKSVGHGITTIEDLMNNEEVWNVMLELTQSIGRQLKIYGKNARGVAIYIRDNKLVTKQWQCRLPKPSQSATYIAREAHALFLRSYQWEKPIRTVTVSAIDLAPYGLPYQRDLFVDEAREEKLARLDNAVFKIRERFGRNAIRNACLLQDIKMSSFERVNTIPAGMTTLM